MSRLQNNAQVLCLRQAIRHEDNAKRNFEKLTGMYNDAKFYQGQAPDYYMTAAQ